MTRYIVYDPTENQIDTYHNRSLIDLLEGWHIQSFNMAEGKQIVV